MFDSTEKKCLSCCTVLKEPYISCVECTAPHAYFCLYCFAKGQEKNQHENSHKYEVVKDNFPIFESDWTAKEELNLLDAIYDCGLGNWDDISNQMGTRSKQECETHYFYYYVENAKSPLIEFTDQNEQDINFPTPIPYKVCDDPPRPALDSQLYNEMAGYMAGRGDFNTEYDNYAEHDIGRMEFTEDDDGVDTNLKLTVLRIYNHRLHERARRKQILAKYGLINIRKAVLSMRRYHSAIGTHVMDGLIGFMQLIEPMSFDLFTESLHYEAELKYRIKALQEFREAGLTRYYSTKLYTRLKQRRNERKTKQKHLDNVLDHIQNDASCQQLLQKLVLAKNKDGTEGLIVPTIQRKAPPPLNLMGMKSYEKLTANERELCSRVRLVPTLFLEFKDILINECQKLGHIRLSQARSLIKIDVNKTRKLFDFLLKEGLIITESSKKS